ncbi:MAG: SulP family inorganic anion transporter [Planctomycetota bacterium]|jgi:SulP family sulfate permease
MKSQTKSNQKSHSFSFKEMFFDFKHVKGDVFGGVTAGIVALPLALAFGVQSGMGAIAGLYGAMMLGVFAAVFGGTRTQISGPTGPMTVVSATVIAAAIEISGSLQAGMGIIIATFLLAGGFQILLGLLKIGKYIKYMPYPVLSGFMTGIGIIIILFQIYPFMGHKSAKSTIKILTQINEPLSSLNWMAIGLGGLTIAIIYLFPKITKVVPSTLVALLAATLTAYFLKLDIPLIGNIPSGFPSLKIGGEFIVDPFIAWTAIGHGIPYIGGFPLDIPLMGEMQPHQTLVREFPLDPFMIGSIINQGISYSSNLPLNVPLVPPDLPLVNTGGLFSIDPSMTWRIIQFAATIAALGAIDSLLTSVIADNITKTKHNSHRELIGQGIGNVASGLIGGLPGAGATMRTIVNINAGGKTRLSGLTHGLLLFAILLGLGKYASYIPMCVLAGILITVGIGIVDYHKGLRHLIQVPRADAVILIIVMAITVFGNLIHAVGVGVVLACVLFMKKASDLAERGTTVTSLGSLENRELWESEKSVYDEYNDKIYIKHMSGPMFFGFTSRFQELIKELDPGIKVLIIRMKEVPYIDQSGVYVLEEAILELRMKGVLVLMTGVQPQPLDMMKKVDIIPGLISEECLFRKFEDCKLWLKHNLKNKSGEFEK